MEGIHHELPRVDLKVMKREAIAIVGYYGAKNCGDDALLLSYDGYSGYQS
jgi:hypothetical protein